MRPSFAGEDRVLGQVLRARAVMVPYTSPRSCCLGPASPFGNAIGPQIRPQGSLCGPVTSVRPCERPCRGVGTAVTKDRSIQEDTTMSWIRLNLTLTLVAVTVSAALVQGRMRHRWGPSDAVRKAGGPLAGVSRDFGDWHMISASEPRRRKPDPAASAWARWSASTPMRKRAIKSHCCSFSAPRDRPRPIRRKSASANATLRRWATAARWPSAMAAIGSGTSDSNRGTFTAIR